MARGYQHGFSAHSRAMFDHARERKAHTMRAVIEHCLDTQMSNSTILVVGGSTGIIDNYLSRHSKHVISLDIDTDAVRYASNNFRSEQLDFIVCDGMNLAFQDNRFDIVICSQVYEHVPDSTRLMAEIHRVLKPGGICYFAAGNRLNVIEPHYRLPFLSIMPKALAHMYLRLLRKGDQYYETHLSYWGLRHLVKAFSVTDYTLEVISNPGQYGTEYMVAPGSLKQKLGIFLSKYCIWLVPGYIWVLRKPSNT